MSISRVNPLIHKGMLEFIEITVKKIFLIIFVFNSVNAQGTTTSNLS